MIFSPPSLPPQIPKITVFVHGTHRAIKAVSSLIPPISKQLNYEPGMHHVSTCPENYCYRKMMATLSKNNPETFPFEHCHVFCWSGKLSHEARLEAAQQLNTELNKLHQQYQNYHLTLITHSHGGNVALNLAAVTNPKSYHIDQLVLVACPVQEKTERYVLDDLFKTIYAPYSSWDTLQVADPQGAVPRRDYVRSLFAQNKHTQDSVKVVTPLFSGRHFPKDSNVKHIHITKHKRPITHIEFLLPSFTKKLGTILETAKHHDFSTKELEFKL